MTPVRVTSACQRVAGAVNDLRVTAKADGTMQLATAEQLHHIEGLKRYINELYTDQGLGFVLLRKTFTFTCVCVLRALTRSPYVLRADGRALTGWVY